MKKSFQIRSPQILKNCLEFISKLESDGKWEVSIGKARKTSPQRNYWHACMQEIAEVSGTDLDDIKFQIKKTVLGLKKWEDKNGIIYWREYSSENLDKETYGRLIDATISLAQILEIRLPEPSYFGYEGILQ